MFLPAQVSAGIQTYAYSDEYAERCPYYAVSIQQNQEAYPSYVHISHARTEGPGSQFLQGRTASWTQFSITGTAFVDVRVSDDFQAFIEDARVYPKSKYVEVEMLDEDILRLYIPGPGQYVLELGDEGYRHPLVILASPWESNPPSGTDSGVLTIHEANKDNWQSDADAVHTLHFTPGGYDFPEYTLPEHIRRVYIEGGAIIYGAFQLDHDHVLIDGRGIISGKKMAHREAHLIESPGTVANVVVEGITLTDYPYFAIRLLGTDSVIRWANMVGAWIYNADGVVVWDRGTVRDSFIMANDDSIKLYDNHVSVSDCVIWNMTNGAVMQLGWSSLEAHYVSVNDIDVVRAEWRPESTSANNGVINLRLANSGDNQQSHYRFNNIRTDTPVLRVIDLRMSGMGPNRAPNYHQVEDVVFRNFDVQMPLLNLESSKNYIMGYDEDHGFKDLQFIDFKLNDVTITQDNWNDAGIFEIDDLSLPEVTFTITES